MKSEKGKPAFPDNVDEVLAEKIMEHTERNSDKGMDNKNNRFYDSPSQKKSCCDKMSKSKCITICIFCLLLIAGAIGFFVFKPACCAKKKRKYPFFF
jgi:hypothetical protein